MTCWVIDGASLEAVVASYTPLFGYSFSNGFLSYFDSFMNYKVMQLPASMIPPIKSPAILLGTEVTRSPEFRVKRNDFQNHTIYVEMKHIPCLFLCQTYGKTGCIIGCLMLSNSSWTLFAVYKLFFFMLNFE